MYSKRANTPSKRINVSMNSNEVQSHQESSQINSQQLVSISDLGEKDLFKVYSCCFPKGSKFSVARCGCGYLHPFISIPSSSLHQIMSNTSDQSFEKSTTNEQPQRIIIRRTPQKEISVFFDAEAADKNKTLMQNIDEGVAFQRNERKINTNNLTANLVSLLGSEDVLGNKGNMAFPNEQSQMIELSNLSPGLENLIFEFEKQIKSLREQLDHITSEKKLIEMTTNAITEKASKQSDEIEKLVDEKNQQRERIHQLKNLLTKYEELGKKKDSEKNELKNEVKKLKNRFENECVQSTEKLKSSLHKREIEVEKLRNELALSCSMSNHRQELEKKENEIQLLQQDLHKIQLELIGKEKSLTTISIKLGAEQERHSKTEMDMQTLSNTVIVKETEIESLNQKLNMERSNYSLLFENYQSMESKLKQEQKLLSRLEQDYSHSESAMEYLKEKYEKAVEQKEELERQFKSKTLELSCREEAFEEELRKIKGEFQSKLNDIQQKNLTYANQIEKLQSDNKEYIFALNSKEEMILKVQKEVDTKIKEYKEKLEDSDLQIQMLNVKNHQKDNELLEIRLLLEKSEADGKENERIILEKQGAIVKHELLISNLDSELKKMDIELNESVSKCSQLEDTIRKLQEQLILSKNDYNAVNEEKRSLEKQIDILREEYATISENNLFEKERIFNSVKLDLENQLLNLSKENKQFVDANNKSESMNEKLKQEIQTKDCTINSLSEIVQEQEIAIQSLKNENGIFNEELVRKEEQRISSETILKSKIDSLLDQIENITCELNSLKEEMTDLKSERQRLLVEYQEASHSLELNFEKCKDQTETIKNLSDMLSNLENDIVEKNKSINTQVKEIEMLKEEIMVKEDCHEKEIEQLTYKIRTLEEQITAKNQELEAIEYSMVQFEKLKQETEKLKLNELEQSENVERLRSELFSKEEEYAYVLKEKDILGINLTDVSNRLEDVEKLLVEKECAISLLMEQNVSITNEITEKTNNIEGLLSHFNEMRESKLSLEESLSDTKQDLEKKVDTINLLEKKIAEKDLEIKQTKEEISKEIALLEKRITLIKTEKEEETEKLSNHFEKQKECFSEKIQELEKQLEEKEIKEKQISGTYSETNMKMSELMLKLDALEIQKKKNDFESERLIAELKIKESEINQMNDKNRALLAERDEISEKLAEMEKTKQKIEANCSSLVKEQTNNQQTIKQMRSECLELKQQIVSFENEITLLKHKIVLNDKINSDLKQDLENSLENADLLEKELKLLRMNSKKEMELLQHQLIHEINERDGVIKELKCQISSDSSLRIELEQVKELSQKSFTLLDEQNEEIKKLQIEVIEYTNILDKIKQENDHRLSEMSASNQYQSEELEDRNRELTEVKLNYQKLESMFFQMERDYRTLQSQDCFINRQLEEKCIQLQNRLEEKIEPITNNEEELKRLTKENADMKDQLLENKQTTEKMEQEIERLLEQLTTSSTVGGIYIGNQDSSLLSSTSTHSNSKTNRSSQSLLTTSHLMQSATTDLKYLWKQLRSEIVRLKQKNVELAQQIMQVTRAREETIVKYEKQLKSTMVDLSHYKKVAEEVEQLKLDNTRLILTKKDSEVHLNNLSIKLSTLEAEKQNLWRLQDQTRKELINLKENVIKLSEENERLSRIESKASNIANLELEKLKKEKRLLEEKLLVANDNSKTQKETTQLMNKMKEARITREKLEKLIRDQKHQLEEMDATNRDLKIKLQNYEKVH